MSEIPQDVKTLINQKVEAERITSETIKFVNRLIDSYCIVQDKYLNRDAMFRDLATIVKKQVRLLRRMITEDYHTEENYYDFVHDTGGDLQSVLFCDKSWVDVDTRIGSIDLEIPDEFKKFCQQVHGITINDGWD